MPWRGEDRQGRLFLRKTAVRAHGQVTPAQCQERTHAPQHKSLLDSELAFTPIVPHASLRSAVGHVREPTTVTKLKPAHHPPDQSHPAPWSFVPSAYDVY